METLRAFLSGCMAFLSFSSPKGSAEALPEVFSPLQNLPAPSHTANTCRIRRLPTLPERLCEIAGGFPRRLDAQRKPMIIFIDSAPVAQLDRASGYEEKAQIPLSRFFGVV